MFVQAEVGIGDGTVTGVQTCALPICTRLSTRDAPGQLAAEAVVDVVARVESRVPVPAEPRLQLHVARIDARARRERSEERRVGKACRSRGAPRLSSEKRGGRQPTPRA